MLSRLQSGFLQDCRVLIGFVSGSGDSLAASASAQDTEWRAHGWLCLIERRVKLLQGIEQGCTTRTPVAQPGLLA